MENSALNLAHQQHRRAETHLKYRRFDEAVLCHSKAAEYLKEAVNSTKVNKALESIMLQYDYHVKQQDIIRFKKEQFESYKKALENQRRRMSNVIINRDMVENKDCEATSLQLAIYKTMEEADSLLGILMRKGIGSDTDSLRSESSSDKDVDVVDTAEKVIHEPVGSKRPKDEQTVIEELRTLNQQLHSLVYQLVTQLDASVRETESLKERIKVLEEERTKSHPASAEQEETAVARQTSLRIITDSSGGNSPFVYSPCSELSPESVQTRELPVLAPLEMPNFDFNTNSNRNT